MEGGEDLRLIGNAKSPPKRARTRALPAVPSISILRAPDRGAEAKDQLCKRFDVQGDTQVLSGGRSGDVFVMPKKNRGVEANRIFAVKQQLISDPDNIADIAYRECRILLQLHHLNVERKCPNFVTLREWFKSHPPLLFGAKHQGREDAKYMFFVLEYAERSLFRQTLDSDEFRSVLFQLLYALSVAQREYQFVHHDLHAKNILLQHLPENTTHLVYHDAGSTWFLGGPVVKIADFGLSRLRLSGSEPEEVIYNVRDSFSEMFSQAADVEKVLEEIVKCRTKGDSSMTLGIKEIRNLLRKGASVREMLRVSYFDCLRQRPENAVAEFCQCYSSDGNISVAELAARGDSPPRDLVASAVPDEAIFRDDHARFFSAERVTRQMKQPQIQYSIYNGKGSNNAKEDTSADASDAYFAEYDAQVLAQEAHERATRQRAQIAAEDKKMWANTQVMGSLPSAASFVMMGATREEMRETPKVKAHREASRLARENEEAMKQLKREKRQRLEAERAAASVNEQHEPFVVSVEEYQDVVIVDLNME